MLLTLVTGLKFVGSDGLFLAPEKCTELFEIADKGKRKRINCTIITTSQGGSRSLPTR